MVETADQSTRAAVEVMTLALAKIWVTVAVSTISWEVSSTGGTPWLKPREDGLRSIFAC